jgi:hypothetical protein
MIVETVDLQKSYGPVEALRAAIFNGVGELTEEWSQGLVTVPLTVKRVATR